MRGAASWTRLEARRLAKTAAMQATGHLGDGGMFLFDYALRALRVVVLLSIWRIVVSANPEASTMPLAALLTYALVAEVFSQQLAVKTELSDSFWQGTLVNNFLRPIGVVRQFAAQASGRWAVDFVFFSVPLLLVAPLLGVDPLPASPAAAALFVASLMLAVAVGLAVEFLFGAVTLISDQPVWLIDWLRSALTGFFSGAVVPLVLLPWGLGDVFAWLPFASMAWAPLAIYTDSAEALPLLALQLAWALTLWPLALALWHFNREKVVSYGG